MEQNEKINNYSSENLIVCSLQSCGREAFLQFVGKVKVCLSCLKAPEVSTKANLI